MRLYLLKANGSVGYDAYDGHVVAARTDEAARALCKHADEGPIWTDPTKSSCDDIGETNGRLGEGIVLSSFNAG